MTKRGHKLETWTITEEGREALKPPQWSAEERSAYMATGSIRYRKEKGRCGRWKVVEDGDDNGNYTTDPSRSVDWDPQMGALPVTDPAELKLRWRRESLERSAGVEDPRARARRLARSARRAA